MRQYVPPKHICDRLHEVPYHKIASATIQRRRCKNITSVFVKLYQRIRTNVQEPIQAPEYVPTPYRTRVYRAEFGVTTLPSFWRSWRWEKSKTLGNCEFIVSVSCLSASESRKQPGNAFGAYVYMCVSVLSISRQPRTLLQVKPVGTRTTNLFLT
jgi:hypothetical protein